MDEDKPRLAAGMRFHHTDEPATSVWIVRHVGPGSATVERELREPRLIEIKDADGKVIRSFLAKRSGEKVQISRNSFVNVLSNEPVEEPNAEEIVEAEKANGE